MTRAGVRQRSRAGRPSATVPEEVGARLRVSVRARLAPRRLEALRLEIERLAARFGMTVASVQVRRVALGGSTSEARATTAGSARASRAGGHSGRRRRGATSPAR